MAEETKEDKSKWISSIGSLIAAISALSVLLSVLYEFGYYRLGVGIPIPAIPTAMNDHIKACFMWLPLAIAVISTLFLTILVLKAKETPKETKKVSSMTGDQALSFKPRNLKKFPLTMIILSTIVAVVLYLLKVPHYYFIASLAWISFYVVLYIAAVFSSIFIKKGTYSNTIYTIAIVFTNLIIYFVSSGYINARSEIETRQYPYEITLKEQSAPKIKANVLRSYDKVTFFVYSSQKLVFMQSDQIKSITKNY